MLKEVAFDEVQASVVYCADAMGFCAKETVQEGLAETVTGTEAYVVQLV
jgi:hypothetical protein